MGEGSVRAPRGSPFILDVFGFTSHISVLSGNASQRFCKVPQRLIRVYVRVLDKSLILVSGGSGVGSEALSRVPGSEALPFPPPPPGRGQQDSWAFGRKRPFDFFGLFQAL